MGYGGTIINLMGSMADLDAVADGAIYRKVVGVNESGQISQSSIGPDVSFSASLADGSVLANHIASGAVQSYHIADGQIQANHISAGAVQSYHIADGQIQANHIASNQIDSDKTMGWSGSFYADGVTFNVVNGLIIGPSGA